ncbi:MAG: HAMP domain-containing histidine kinase [Lachnospiraceae bacterium]|nr:HAMP domain-containing histidine kinase [Lachnospiraceae bacterium]
MGKLKDMTLKRAFYLIVSVTAVIVLCLSAVSVRTCSRIHDRTTLSHAFMIDTAVFDYEGGGYHTMEVETGSTEDGLMEFTGRELWICRITEILIVFLPMLFSVIGIVCAGTYFYQVKLKEPLTALKQGISHIADNDLDFTIGYGKQDELGELCKAFETMRGELVKNNRYMWGLVDERKRINASIAHDLRTPITVIKGYSEYLDRNAGKEILTGDGTREIAGYINKAAVRLEEYADSVREVQALEDMRLEYEEILLGSFLQEIRAQLSVIARQNRKEICLQAEMPEQTVVLSAAAVFRIIENIVDNSLRYCRERIDVEVSLDSPFIIITIIDDGRGFSEKERVEATDYFYKGKMEEKHSMEKKHFGIGLTICRILAQKHGGVILLDNAPEGGARVTVKIKFKEISSL